MSLYCPDCKSEEKVVLVSETSWYANSGDFYCHSVKTHDLDATARCLECDWVGMRKDLGDTEK